MVNTGRGAAIANTPTGRALPLLLNPFWANLPPAVVSLPKDYFAYAPTTDFLPLAAATTAAREVLIQADSAFLILDITGTVTDAATDLVVQATPPLLIQLRDEGSGRNMFSRARHWLDVVGTAQLPKYLDYPKILKPRTTFTVTIQNLSGAAGFNIRPTFHGFKLFAGEGFAELLSGFGM